MKIVKTHQTCKQLSLLAKIKFDSIIHSDQLYRQGSLLIFWRKKYQLRQTQQKCYFEIHNRSFQVDYFQKFSLKSVIKYSEPKLNSKLLLIRFLSFIFRCAELSLLSIKSSPTCDLLLSLDKEKAGIEYPTFTKKAFIRPVDVKISVFVSKTKALFKIDVLLD